MVDPRSRIFGPRTEYLTGLQMLASERRLRTRPTFNVQRPTAESRIAWLGKLRNTHELDTPVLSDCTVDTPRDCDTSPFSKPTSAR